GSTNHGYYSSVDQMNGGMLVEAGIPKIPRAFGRGASFSQQDLRPGAFSSMAMYHQQQYHERSMHSEFNASMFNGYFQSATIPPRSHSVLGLAVSVYDEAAEFPPRGRPHHLAPYSTQSLDRRLFSKSRQRSASMDGLHVRRGSGGGGGRRDDFEMYRNHGSMSSMGQSAESDDVKQYRDVAL
ncbi:unnamed protein product, partial [Notodromas monacha]